MDATDPRYAAVQALTAYWLAHPQASDTLEGICRWWLDAGSFLPSEVEAALAWLAAHGTVLAHRAGDGRVRYRLAEPPRSDLP